MPFCYRLMISSFSSIVKTIFLLFAVDNTRGALIAMLFTHNAFNQKLINLSTHAHKSRPLVRLNKGSDNRDLDNGGCTVHTCYIYPIENSLMVYFILLFFFSTRLLKNCSITISNRYSHTLCATAVSLEERAPCNLYRYVDLLYFVW